MTIRDLEKKEIILFVGDNREDLKKVGSYTGFITVDLTKTNDLDNLEIDFIGSEDFVLVDNPSDTIDFEVVHLKEKDFSRFEIEEIKVKYHFESLVKFDGKILTSGKSLECI